MAFAKNGVWAGLVSIGFVSAVFDSCGTTTDGSHFRTGSAGTTGATSSTGGAAGATMGPTSSTTGPTSSTTTIMPPPTGAGGTGAGGSSVNPDAACATTVENTQQIPTDVYVLEDRSGSMDCAAAEDACTVQPKPPNHPSRWDAFTTAVNGFVMAPGSAGIGVGIGFFPGIDCTPAGFPPAVPIAPLPGNAMAIASAIAATGPGGGTPTLPALTGALEYAKTYTMNTPGRAAAVVMVTDGVPNGCNSSIPATAMVAQQYFQGMPQIKTYVVGLGDTAALDQIALAGSGGMTHYFRATGDVAGQLTAALKVITGMISCNYTVPTMTAVDPNLVNVQVTVGMGAPTSVGRVNDVSACGALGGWYYDNNTKPTQISICPTSCDPLKMTAGSAVQILYGCPSVPPAIRL